MKPIPVVFHIGPLQIHTYGIGLALTFLFAAWYLTRRLRAKGLSSEWVGDAAFWIIIAAVIGARVVHVVANAGFYIDNPSEIPVVWHGGLSSFGGLLFAVPTGIYLAKKRAPEIGTLRGLDIAVPVLAAAWSLGRLLGPQVMVNGGGHRTNAWYGMAYAGQQGDRVPVPIFQSLMDLVTFLILIAIDRRTDGHPRGAITALGAGLWGFSRFIEEWFWLGVPGRWDSVEVIGLIMSAAGWIWLALIVRRSRTNPGPPPDQDDGAMASAAS
jgi:phosphatidylglycerol:prolipoprotein diacylglycerol transferase